ncbi:MAG: hypothetical protein WCA35_14690 [Kovacikia sp.]
MLQTEVWSANGVGETVQAQPQLVQTQPSRLRTGIGHPNTTPDASLVLIPIFLIVVWAIVAFPFFREISKARLARANFLKASKIPCQNCRFSSKSSYLKCAIHPTTAMTEAAANCSDYCPNRSDMTHRNW